MTRRCRIGDLTQEQLDQACDDARHDFDTQYSEVEIMGAIIEAAAILAHRHSLRAYDAVQLATALELRHILIQNEPVPPDFNMISADRDNGRGAHGRSHRRGS